MFKYLEDFAERPFRPDMGLFGWVLFIGLLIIVAGLWAHILNLISPR